MATIITHQNNFAIFTKLSFPNGLAVVIVASPLSPEVGREVLGAFTEDYVLIGLMQPYSRFYPFLRGQRLAEDYIKDRLGIDTPISSLMYALLPQLTKIDLPDFILRSAEDWYQFNFS